MNTSPQAAGVTNRQPPLPSDALALDQPIRLIDGTVVRGRPIMWDDDDRLRAFHASCSLDTITFRFFAPVPTLTAEAAHHFTHVDYENRMALVATTGTGAREQIIGVVRYERIGAETAEVAFVVQDHYQGHGVATALLHRLAPYAKARGLTTLVALTMLDNHRMLEVLRNAGYPYTIKAEGTDLEVRLAI